MLIICRIVIVDNLQEMQKKSSQRLSTIEKSQAETNRRLEDVLKNNQDFQAMLMQSMQSMQSVISNFCKSNAVESGHLPRAGNTAIGESSADTKNDCGIVAGNSAGIGRSEQWWDDVCGKSDEEQHRSQGYRNTVSTVQYPFRK